MIPNVFIARIFMRNLVSFVVVWSSDQILRPVRKFRIFCCSVFPLMIPFPLFEFTMEPKILLVDFKKYLIEGFTKLLTDVCY